MNLTQNEPAAGLRLGRSVSIDQAAHLLNVSRRTVYYRIRDGRLRTIRTLGGSQRVLVESLSGVGVRPPSFPVGYEGDVRHSSAARVNHLESVP